MQYRVYPPFTSFRLEFILSFLRPRTDVNARVVIEGLSEEGRNDGLVPGATALWLAAAMGHSECVEQLLDCVDIAPHLPAADGRTPLMVAEGEGHDLCVALLRHGTTSS